MSKYLLRAEEAPECGLNIWEKINDTRREKSFRECWDLKRRVRRQKHFRNVPADVISSGKVWIRDSCHMWWRNTNERGSI